MIGDYNEKRGSQGSALECLECLGVQGSAWSDRQIWPWSTE